MIIVKSDMELARMREAGKIVAAVLQELAQRAVPGVTTAELNDVAHEMIAVKYRAIPSFLGYRGYPASVCISINEQIVHGIPGQRHLVDGDIVSFDVGAIYKGYHGDAAITVGIGSISGVARSLIEVAEAALGAAISEAVSGNRVGDISHAIQEHAESRGYSVVREYVGHGIGRSMHEDPQVPNFGEPGRKELLKPGMTMALEPMVNVGEWPTRVLEDGWTVVTADGSLSAHFEHTVVITESGPEIMTAL
jgi:methionyl aminopeptidase